MSDVKVSVESLGHRYGERVALDGVSFAVKRGEIFGLVGPNGGGKSTLFRILSTIQRPTSGTAKVATHDVNTDPAAVRATIGVLFQSPAIDKKLTVRENLRHQGHLYGILGANLRARTALLLSRVGLEGRENDFVESLSGGLQRRVEIAKCLLHSPQVLLLDEPTTGLDPLARRELWRYLRLLREKDGMTILLTTHLLDEADACDRVALLHGGKLLAEGDPETLKSSIGGQILSIRARQPERLLGQLAQELSTEVSLVDGLLRIEADTASSLVADLLSRHGGEIDSVTLGKPTLEDLFIRKTGHGLWQDAAVSGA